MRYQISSAALLTLILFSSLSAQVGTNLVLNGEFDDVGSLGLDTTHDGQSPGLSNGQSAAEHWGVWHNTNGSTATTLLTYDEAGIDSIDPFQDRATDRLLRVEASDISNGLVQVLSPFGTGPMSAEGSVWLYVTSGQAGVGIGNGGGTPILKSTTLTGQWEELQFSNSGVPINEITIYSQSSGVEFYVDRVSVTAVPEPGSAIALVLSGIGAALFRRRRR